MFWELESLGISEEEKTLYDEFAGNITFQDGCYKVSLPWKEFHEFLADSYLCVRRLRGLLQRLKHDPEILKEYDRTIQEQLAKGVIEPVFPDEKTTNRVHYLPQQECSLSGRLPAVIEDLPLAFSTVQLYDPKMLL